MQAAWLLIFPKLPPMVSMPSSMFSADLPLPKNGLSALGKLFPRGVYSINSARDKSMVLTLMKLALRAAPMFISGLFSATITSSGILNITLIPTSIPSQTRIPVIALT